MATVKRSAKRYLEEKKAPVSRPRAPDRQLNRDDVRDLISRQAYGFFERRGRVHGFDVGDWLEAERTVTEILAK